jgi:5-epi-alpha-selinene synthase
MTCGSVHYGADSVICFFTAGTMQTLASLSLPQRRSVVDLSLLEALHNRTRELCERVGLIRPDRMSLQKFRAARFELLTSLVYPDADLDQLAICNDFITYLFYVDDQAEEDEAYGKRPEVLQHYFEAHIAALREGARVSEGDAAGLLLMDIRARLVSRASQRWLRRFADDVQSYLLRGTLAGARHWTAGTVPGLEEYAAQRRWDSAVLCTQDLIVIAGPGELSADILRRPEWVELRNLCADVVAFTNDLVSYPKEVRRHGSPNNLLHVIVVHENRCLEDAIVRVIQIINDAVKEFERIAAALASQGPQIDARINHYLAAQRAWMIGNLCWSLETGRYADPESPFIELRDALSPSRRLERASRT